MQNQFVIYSNADKVLWRGMAESPEEALAKFTQKAEIDLGYFVAIRNPVHPWHIRVSKILLPIPPQFDRRREVLHMDLMKWLKTYCVYDTYYFDTSVEEDPEEDYEEEEYVEDDDYEEEEEYEDV